MNPALYGSHPDAETAPHAPPGCLPPPEAVQLFHQAGVSVQYYDIRVPSLAEVPLIMRSTGPVDDEGIRRDALLSWHIWWRWEPRERPRGDTVRVRSSSLLILPRWCPVLQPSDEERREWARYLVTVLEHEAGHALIFLDHIQPFRARLHEFFSKCKNCLATDGNRFGSSLVNELNTVQREYDERTRHGATQNARLQSAFLVRRDGDWGKFLGSSVSSRATTNSLAKRFQG